mgnify:CR=1 FL=1
MRILSIFGTRPEAIKMAPVIKELEKSKEFESLVCVTAQHREMLDQVLSLFDINPDYDLDIMMPGQTLAMLTERIISKLDKVILESKPSMILVHGDTTTTFVSSLCAFYHKIPIGHVEAGLRTGNLYSPWPEEGNRKLTGSIASLHFAPTEKSKQNLLAENVPEDKILVTGNTVIDSLLSIVDLIDKNEKENDYITNLITRFPHNNRIILITAHRRENFGSGFQNICEAILELSEEFSDVEFVFPVHLNPNVRRPVAKILSDKNNIHLIEPLEYLPFVDLMSKSYLVLTDSGGIQEEAPSLGKPVLVMRDTTERPEAVDAGTVIIVGTEKNSIINNTTKLLQSNELYDKMSVAHNPYGDGLASIRIVKAIHKFLQ